MTAICNAHLGSAYSKGGVMGPMITYHDTVALKFPLKSPHHEETANIMIISKPEIPKGTSMYYVITKGGGGGSENGNF